MEQIKEISGKIVELENQINELRRNKSFDDTKLSSIWWALEAAESALTSIERTLWTIKH